MQSPSASVLLWPDARRQEGTEPLHLPLLGGTFLQTKRRSRWRRRLVRDGPRGGEQTAGKLRPSQAGDSPPAHSEARMARSLSF